MTHKIVALYADHMDACRVRDELVRAGFCDVMMKPQPLNAVKDPAFQPKDVMEEVKSFLGFGYQAGHYDPERYSCRGGTFIAVDAGDEDRTREATRIMEQYSPIDLDNRAEHWHAMGFAGFNACGCPPQQSM